MKTKNDKTPVFTGVPSSDRGRIRTFDRLLRRQMLYPAELRDPLCGCKDTNVNGCKKYFF